MLKILEDMLRVCKMDFSGSWEDHFHLVEFSYNNSYQVNNKMILFKALYKKEMQFMIMLG